MKFKKNHLIGLLAITLLALFLRLYNLEKTYSFGWDQERDAWMMWQMIVDHKPTLIGPRVVSDTGFFLGPLWYYILLPFYIIFRLNPIAGGYFTAFFGTITTISIFVIFKKLLGIKKATIGSLIWAVFPDRVAWNPVLIPLASLLVTYYLINLKDKYIPTLFLLFALALQLHIQAIFLLVPISFALFQRYKKSKFIPFRNIIIGIAIVLASFIPLLIFDLRHDFINAKTIINFFHTAQTSEHTIFWHPRYFLSALSKYFAYVSWFIPIEFKFAGFLVIAFSLIGVAKSKIKKYAKRILFSTILLSPVVFSLYRGDLSEYYFAICLIPILMGLVLALNALSKNSPIGKLTMILWLGLLIKNNFYSIVNEENKTSLYYKKQAVKYIVNQNIDPIFNISYSTGYDGDSGFRYLFKYYGREPQNIPEGHLWTITIPAHREDKKLTAQFGDIGIIRR